MKIDKAVIAPKLAKIKGFLPGKSIDNSIHGVLFKENWLTATNSEIGIKTRLEAGSEETFIIPERAIELIEQLPSGEISITPDENHSIIIKSNNIVNKFQSYDPAIYSEFDINSDYEVGKIDSQVLEKGIKASLYAVGNNTIKPFLNGIYFSSANGKLNLVGCDGYRVAWFKTDNEKEFSFIVPKVSLQKILSVGFSGDIQIYSTRNHAIFKTEEYIILTNLYEGPYLGYEKMFIKRGKDTSIQRAAMLEAIKRCMLCVDDKNKGIIKLNMEGDTVTIYTMSETSEYTEKMKLEKSISEPLLIAFNGLYLMDLLKSFEGEKIDLNFGLATDPMIAAYGDQSAMVLPVKIAAR